MGRILSYKHGERSTENVDPRLWDIVRNAIAAIPYDAEIRSGAERAKGDLGNHSGGYAVDVTLIDPKTGEIIPDTGKKGGAASVKVYEQYAQAARVYQQQKYPELDNTFRWGGGFRQGYPFDLMHLDITPKRRGAMAYYDWERGFTPAALRAMPELDGQVTSGLGGAEGRRRVAQIRQTLTGSGGLLPPADIPVPREMPGGIDQARLAYAAGPDASSPQNDLVQLLEGRAATRAAAERMPIPGSPMVDGGDRLEGQITPRIVGTDGSYRVGRPITVPPAGAYSADNRMNQQGLGALLDPRSFSPATRNPGARPQVGGTATAAGAPSSRTAGYSRVWPRGNVMTPQDVAGLYAGILPLAAPAQMENPVGAPIPGGYDSPRTPAQVAELYAGILPGNPVVAPMRVAGRVATNAAVPAMPGSASVARPPSVDRLMPGRPVITDPPQTFTPAQVAGIGTDMAGNRTPYIPLPRRRPTLPPIPADVEDRVTARNRAALAIPSLPLPRPRPLTAPTAAEIQFGKTNFGDPYDMPGVGMPKFADIADPMGRRGPMPPMPVPMPAGLRWRHPLPPPPMPAPFQQAQLARSRLPAFQAQPLRIVVSGGRPMLVSDASSPASQAWSPFGSADNRTKPASELRPGDRRYDADTNSWVRK